MKLLAKEDTLISLPNKGKSSPPFSLNSYEWTVTNNNHANLITAYDGPYKILTVL